MKALHTPVKMVQVEIVCESCEQGTYVFNKMVLDRDPIVFQHKCTHCGAEVYFNNKYPALGNTPAGEKETVELTDDQKHNL